MLNLDLIRVPIHCTDYVIMYAIALFKLIGAPSSVIWGIILQQALCW